MRSMMMMMVMVFPSIVASRIIRTITSQCRRGHQHDRHHASYHKDQYSAAQATTSFCRGAVSVYRLPVHMETPLTSSQSGIRVVALSGLPNVCATHSVRSEPGSICGCAQVAIYTLNDGLAQRTLPLLERVFLAIPIGIAAQRAGPGFPRRLPF